MTSDETRAKLAAEFTRESWGRDLNAFLSALAAHEAALLAERDAEIARLREALAEKYGAEVRRA